MYYMPWSICVLSECSSHTFVLSFVFERIRSKAAKLINYLMKFRLTMISRPLHACKKNILGAHTSAKNLKDPESAVDHFKIKPILCKANSHLL